jgi:hypothetical protein
MLCYLNQSANPKFLAIQKLQKKTVPIKSKPQLNKLGQVKCYLLAKLGYSKSIIAKMLNIHITLIQPVELSDIDIEFYSQFIHRDDIPISYFINIEDYLTDS